MFHLFFITSTCSIARSEIYKNNIYVTYEMIPQTLLHSLLPLEWNDNSENMKNSAAVVITLAK